ncbi:MAG: AIR synthase-related protein, partial [Spirochaetia bacterium]
ATFSSLALDEASPTSAVQIGDPITQKKMTDFLLEARDLGLYKGITDNGAGGLSSSLGEMAEDSGGIVIELDKCPLKYQGLAAWEILVSESQERMSLAVDPAKIDEFLDLAKKRDVEASVVGRFTDSGKVSILREGSTVGELSLDFLHNGLPVMRLKAQWVPPSVADSGTPKVDLKKALLDLLSDPNIRSKEKLVRQYDHEVQAQSVTKPFTGIHADAPSDGAVLTPRYDSFEGITVTHGICPRYSDTDTYAMAVNAVDEAYRAHIACGGDPDFAAALDNFCWPDPVESEKTPDGRYKLAQLVRACRGLHDACVTYGLPLISGKDSMKNDANLAGKKVSVRPTLLISLMGKVRDIRKTVCTDFIEAGDSIWLIGHTKEDLGCSAFSFITKSVFSGVPLAEPRDAVRLYRKVHTAIEEGFLRSCHDLSEGGLAVAAVESAFGQRLGAKIDVAHLPAKEGVSELSLLFGETPSRFIVTVRQKYQKNMEELFSGFSAAEIGKVDDSGEVVFTSKEKELLRLNMQEMTKAWKEGEF